MLGDPSVRLAVPRQDIKINKIYSSFEKTDPDTLKAQSKVSIEGQVVDSENNLNSSFGGIAYVTIYDKPKSYATLSSNGAVMNYSEQKNLLFKGKASVKNGSFKVTLIIPKNIDYEYGNGKINIYAFDEDQKQDAHLGFDEVVVGGSAPPDAIDNTAPAISLFMDDESFQAGGLTGSNTILLGKISDESGINITSNGLNQDISAQWNNQEAVNLNAFYEADIDTYQNGWLPILSMVWKKEVIL